MTSRPGRARYSGGSGIALATRLVETGHYIFTTEQARRAAAEIGMPQSSVAVTLGRLAEAAWILRLRRGLYAGTGRLPGGFDIHPFAVATSLVHPSAVSHWSALSYHGLTSQVPRTVTATTPKKVMTPSMRGPAGERDHRKGKHLWRAAGLEIEYVKIRLDRFFGTEDVWVDEHFRVSVTDVERSVLDMFASPRTFGGLDAGLATLEEHAERLDLQRLAEYSLRFASKAVSARLGWCLEKVGAGALVLEQLRSHVGPGIQVLDPTRAARGHRDARWCVLDNVSPSD